MYDVLQIAATGMQAQQFNLDTLANNLANLSTPGYKRARVGFQDLVGRLAEATPTAAGAGATPSARSRQVGAAVGAGVGTGVAGVY